MKHEILIRGIGEMDDRILERYHAIDTRLASKIAHKANVLRVVIVAACVAILLCACVPAGMMAHPVGRAVLAGDSEALSEQLNKIDGFVLWQDKTAEKLEQTLPQPLWVLMQDVPVLNVLTRSQFSGLAAQDSFADGKPYRLYFVSGGDGTCTLEYITTAPEVAEGFVIEIPETSPAGDIVTAINIDQFVGAKQWHDTLFPYALTPETMHELCEIAVENDISDFDLRKLRAYYLRLSVAGLDDISREELTSAYPIAAIGDIYVFDKNASGDEVNKIYQYLVEYCEWDEEKYEQSVDEIVQLAKQSGNKESAELCLTVLRDAALDQVVGITIPKTVSSINNAMWVNLPSLESVTVAEDNPTLKMIDGCLMDTETGTLKLYMREDGKFPANADIRILDSYAFALCDLQLDMDEGAGEVSLQIPEGVTQINKHCFAGISCGEAMVVNIHLPASLKFFGGETQKASDYFDLIFCYPGTLEEWERSVTFGDMDEEAYMYLLITDATKPFKFRFPKK